MKLLWQIDTQVDPRYLSLTAADCALWMEGVSRPCAVNIRICGDDAIHEINREYRGVDRATDVLSFPTVNYPAGKTAGQCDKLLARELDDEVDACMLGDLIISMPHVLAQAAEYGHSPEREAAYLTVHGLCHLMGYDHIEDEDKKKMRAMEEKILSAIGMTRDGEMQTDVSDETLLEMARQAMLRSYSPYSGYPVGAALIARVLHGSGDIHLADYGEGEVSLLRSEVRKMTLRLREQSAQLEKEKLQLADAMADISHQMRTPLTAVNLLLTSLAGHVDEESRGDVRALRRQVARMDWLVESLLKLAKLDAGTARFCPETIPLSALLARAAEPFAIGMELRGQQLQVEASGNVRCDPAWTAEALGNILKNCSEHMQEGTITVRAEENAVASVVVIRDTGGGIAPQDLPHLFERYYKGENAPEQSVGIGLALSRSIAAAQNGTLTAANVPGGAEFTMKLYKGIV